MSRESSEQARKGRARRRAAWPVRRFGLGEEPSDDLSQSTTAQERLAMMWELAVEAWRLTGRPMPSYTREEMPGRIIRSSDG